MTQSSGLVSFACFLLSISLCLLMKAGWCCEPSERLLTQCIMFGFDCPCLKQRRLYPFLKLHNLFILDLNMPVGKLDLIDSYHFMAQALNSVFSDPSLKIMK